MTNQLLLISWILLFVHASNTCFKDHHHHINYLFLDDMSQIKIPLLPLDCLQCQSAYQINIQLIDEQSFGNRTIQRIKIYLKNFEIEDSSYICLIVLCPILVEYGSDSILINITSSLFSHVFLSLIYLNYPNNSLICSIQTRFSIISFKESLKCSDRIYLHPRLNIQLAGQLIINDCRADFFQKSIYQSSVQFDRRKFSINNPVTTMIKSSEKICQYILDNTCYINNISEIKSEELITTINLIPFYNPWNKRIQTLGPCRTKIIPYRDMFFTDDIVNIRNVKVEQGQTVQIRCPIDGSEKYLKYIWYYQRYQPKYQISTNRTIILNNITEQMQGKYMCIGDDDNEKFEFEMTLHVIHHKKTFHYNLILILVITLILFCLILTLLTCFSFKNYLQKFSKSIVKKKSSIDYSIHKQNSLTVHHDVMVTIRHLSEQQTINSLWNQPPYQSLDYIDDQPIYEIPAWSWIKESNSEIIEEQIPHRFSTRHLDTIGYYRNINGQPPISMNTSLIQSNTDITSLPIVKFNQLSDSTSNSISEPQDDIEILKISIPLLNQYPLVKSTSSIISFDSQTEVDEFNQMTFVCIESEYNRRPKTILKMNVNEILEL